MTLSILKEISPTLMPVVTFKSVSHTYPPSRPALSDIDLTIGSGERVGLIGPSGAGKSTLLRLCNGLIIPTAGEVNVLGQEIGGLRAQQLIKLRRRIGMIFQEFALIERLPVLTNVLVGRLGYTPHLSSLLRVFPREEVQRAREALRLVGLEAFEEPLVRDLSGGQKQRVGIARAMVQEPELILGDEPTANLDVKTADSILGLLVKLAEDRSATLILTLHDVRAARRFCTRIVALKDGRIRWEGPASEFGDSQMEDVFYGEV